MRILSITAGAAGMICGSCLRDNALAAELTSRGHDVLLLPLYTPTLTDEPNVSKNRVFFGGFSVYLQQKSSFFRWTPWLLDRLWDAPSVIRAATRFSVSREPRLLGELTLSVLRGEDGFQRKEIEKLLHWLSSQPPPDVINLPNSLLSGLARPLKEALGRPVCCTLQGEDLFLDGLSEEHRARAIELIRANAEHVDAFLPVSDYCARSMSEYAGLAAEKMEVVPLGISLRGLDPAPREPGRPFTVGYFARVAPEKGLHNLVEAYGLVRKKQDPAPSRLEVAGYLGPEHRGYFRTVIQRVKELGFQDEFRYRGAPDRQGKIDFLRTLDVLSVPSGYREPKGIYLLEAMACGVPVVQPAHGAFPEIIEKTARGVLVDSETPEHVAEGILSISRTPALAAELATSGARGVREHYHVGKMAERVLEVYASLMGGRLREGKHPETLAWR